MDLNAITIVCLGLLVIMLGAVSWFDYKTGSVKKRYSFIILSLCIILWLSNDPTIKDGLILVACMFGLIFIGNHYVAERLYGGADIHLSIALLPLIQIMGAIGWLVIVWLYAIVPLLSFLSAKYGKISTQEIFANRKIRFIPIISLVFISLLSAWLWSIS